MLTRRLFASCALCGITGAVTGFAATEVKAQPAGTTAVTRKILQQTDGPAEGYVTIIVEVQIDPGALVPWHTHPGIESAYIVEGGGELMVKGQPNRQAKPGDGFQIPTATPHALQNGDKPTKVAATYVIEKGKPLASPASPN
jgi:quercetin dioxygenase-like cupin family protein